MPDATVMNPNMQQPSAAPGLSPEDQQRQLMLKALMQMQQSQQQPGAATQAGGVGNALAAALNGYMQGRGMTGGTGGTA